MKSLWLALFLPLLIVSACDQSVPQDKLPVKTTQVTAMVSGLYREVVARHPLGSLDRKVFGPYLSKALLRSFDAEDACFDHWRRVNPDPNLKPNVGMIEFGAFSGNVEDAYPQSFQIEKVEESGKGSSRVHVKLTYTENGYKKDWGVVVVVLKENGRPVVNDIIFLKQKNSDEIKLSDIFSKDCESA